MDHELTCRTYKNTGAARCGKCGRTWPEMLPHHPHTPFRGWWGAARHVARLIGSAAGAAKRRREKSGEMGNNSAPARFNHPRKDKP